MQISESIGLGTILALSGGFMDAYSYIERGKVFANAQTGNMLLFGVNLSEGNYQTMLNYLLLHWESHWQTRSVQKNRTCFTGDRFLSLQKP
mgnify:CR=1 FL=1